MHALRSLETRIAVAGSPLRPSSITRNNNESDSGRSNEPSSPRRRRRRMNDDEEESLTEPLLPSDNDENDEPNENTTNDVNSNSPNAPTPSDANNDTTSDDPPIVARTILWITLFGFLGRSLWQSSVLATYVYLLTDRSPAAVGTASAVSGLAQLVVSLPTGWYADQLKKKIRNRRRRWNDRNDSAAAGGTTTTPSTFLSCCFCCLPRTRTGLLRLASVLGLTSVFGTVGLMADSPPVILYGCLLVALAGWGAAWGISNTLLQAILADAVAQGQRSKVFTQRAVRITAGNMGGPLVSLILFATVGNAWSLRECRFVIAVGQIVSIPGMLLLCKIKEDDDDDDDSNDAAQTATATNRVEENDDASSSRNDTDDEDDDDDLESLIFSPNTRRNLGYIPPPPPTRNDLALLSPPPLATDEPPPSSNSSWNSPGAAAAVSTMENENDSGSDGDQCGEGDITNIEADDSSLESLETWWGECFCSRQRSVPILIASADVLSGLSSGMSIRFFPLFFVNDLKLSPVLVQVLYIAAPALIVPLQSTVQRLARVYGRCPVHMTCKWIGITLMILMILGFAHWDWPVAVVAGVYVVRTAFMNCSSALTRSVLMDAVPTEERGQWAALESVNMFSWSGSAWVGGKIVEACNGNILPLFAATAVGQFLATLPIFALCSTAQRRRELEES